MRPPPPVIQHLVRQRRRRLPLLGHHQARFAHFSVATGVSMLVLGEFANQNVEWGLDSSRGLASQLDDPPGIVRFFFVPCQLCRPQVHHALPHLLEIGAFLRGVWVGGCAVGAGALTAAATPPVLLVLLALELLLVLVRRRDGRRHHHLDGRPRTFAWHNFAVVLCVVVV
jgi:hypothetical protein